MIYVKLDMEQTPTECHECPLQLKFKDGEHDDWAMRRCVVTYRVIEYPRPQWCPIMYSNDSQCELNNKLIDTLHSQIMFHNCNNCGKQCDCEYVPALGDQVRSNCPLWKEK